MSPMDQVPLDIVIQIASSVISLVGVIIALVWGLGRIKADNDVQFAEIKGNIKLVQSTVHPYAEDIEKNRTGLSDLRQRLSKMEGAVEQFPRDVARLEERINRVMK